MHVAVVAPEFPPEIGGMQTYAVEFVRELVARGHRVTVLTRQRPTPAPVLAGVAVLQVLQVLQGRAGADLAAVRAVSADAWHVMNAAYSWVSLHRAPTVVSIHGNDFLAPYIPVGEPDFGRVPLLWRSTVLRPALQRWVGRWRTPRLVRAGLRRATHILANSRYTERVFVERFPECQAHTSAGMVGVGAGFLARPLQPVASRVPRLITICRLSEERKNVDLVLRALASIQHQHDFHYTVVGDGRLRPALERLAQQLGMAPRVTFTGFMAADAMAQALQDSDLFVLVAAINPDSHEGFGIVYLEANACGVPTLAANLAGAAEAVADGVSGYFVKSLDVAGVAQALARFCAGERQFSPQACRQFAQRFTWGSVVDAALPWYGPAATGAAPVPVAAAG